MSREYIREVGTIFLRREYEFTAKGDYTIRVSADPHTYIRDCCQIINQEHWLMGGTYIKYHIWLDGVYIGCGNERPVIDTDRVEHCFELKDVRPGKHLLAIAFRGEKQGLNAGIYDAGGSELAGYAWKFYNANMYDAHFCYRQQNICGYFKGDIGPGEFFEHLDGTYYPDNWQNADFDDSAWEEPVIVSGDFNTVPASYNLVTTFVHPQKLYKTAENAWIADFGEESIASFILTGPENGGEIEVRLAEELIDREHVRFQLRCTVCYQENWLFAPGRQQLGNFGVREFRYAEIRNYEGVLHPEDITIRRIHAPFSDSSTLVTGNENLRRIWELCKRSVKNTATDSYTDCFTRERIAYEADAMLNMLASFAVSDTLTTARRHLEYQLTHLTWPVEWQQFVACLYYDYYQETGDKELVAKHFDEVVRISAFEDWITGNGLIAFFGENPRCTIDWPPSYRDDYDAGNGEYLFVPNAIAAKVMLQLAYLAGEIGRQQDADRLRSKGEKIRQQLNTLCYNIKSQLYTDRVGSDNCSFHANMWALWCDIAPEKRQEKPLELISGSGMRCSLYSGFIYLETLFRYGKGRQAAQLLLGDESPWMTMIRMGNTITCEYWPDKDQRMSVAHPWGSYPAYLIARYIFGLRPTSPGWKTYAVDPVDSGITGASLSLNKRICRCSSEI